jgi:Transglycosylase SLT domain/LysM domain
MSTVVLRHSIGFRSVIGMLFLIPLGTACSHALIPNLAPQEEIQAGAGTGTRPAREVTLGTPTSTSSVASTTLIVMPVVHSSWVDTPRLAAEQSPGLALGSIPVDLATIYPVDEVPRRTGATLATTTAPRMSDFPIVINDRVKAALKYLQTHRSDDIAQAFWRARRYAGMMRAIFQEYDLPEELVNLAFVESDVNPRATSHAQAAGIWQFVPSTARTYGMRTTASLDERRDPDKSTRAAAEHLKSLYSRFQAWPLALAAYNAGENAVQRAIKRQHTRNFWQLRLPKETRRFVPKFMAMTIIARDPKRYGFSPPAEEPHDTEILHVSQPTDIRQIAEAAGTTVKHLRELNPELVGPTTPSDQPRYALRIPRRFTWVSHKVQNGETLTTIARNYKASVQMLREVNKLDQRDDPQVGRVILVPAKASPPPA